MNKIEVIEEYLKYFPNDTTATKNLLLCKYSSELGIELGEGYYPRIEYGYFVINRQIKAGKHYNLTNTATNYKQNEEDTIIIWSESCGRLAFVDQEYWYCVDSEWKEFMNVLKSYSPLDYDDLNNTYIFNLKNGKKLIADYEKIENDFIEKARKKIKEKDIERKKKEIERLQAELNSNN